MIGGFMRREKGMNWQSSKQSKTKSYYYLDKGTAVNWTLKSHEISLFVPLNTVVRDVELKQAP